LLRFDVPDLRQLFDVRVVLPVAESRQVPVGAAFTGVLRGGLAVRLQQPAAGPAEHAAQQMQVVDLYGGGSALMRLVEALQHGRQQPRRIREDSPARSISAGGRSQTCSAHCGVQSDTCLASSSKPTVCACT
jgi:hypothetical protein